MGYLYSYVSYWLLAGMPYCLNTNGVYIMKEDDFFKPLHIFHLKKYHPELLKYLGLPPGARFLLGENDYKDVWFDESLMNS
jgi:hypothetical protein